MFKPQTKEHTSKVGNKYTFQTVLPSVWAGVQDRITDKYGKMLNTKAIPEILEKVVVQPSGLSMDDFETWAECEEVATAGFNFQRTGK